MSTTVKPHWFWTKRNDVWVSSWHGGQLQSNPIGSGPNAMLSFTLTWGSTTVKPIGSGPNAMMFEFHPDMGVNYSQTPLVLDQTQWCLSFIQTWGSTTVKPHRFWTKRNDVWVSSWHGVNYSQTPLVLDQTQCFSFILTWRSTTVKPHWFWTKHNVWVSSWHGGQLQSNPIGSGPNTMFEFHPDMGVNYSQTPLDLDQRQWCLRFILTWGSTTVKPHWFWTKRNVWVSSWHGGQLQSNPIGSGPNTMFEFHPDMGVNYSQTPLVLNQTQCLSFILTWRSTTVKPHWIWTKGNDVWVSSWHGGQLQSNPIGSGLNAMFEFHPDMGVNYSQPHWFWTKRMMFEFHPDMGVYFVFWLGVFWPQWCVFLPAEGC